MNDAGRVCMIPRGVYDPTVTYGFLDVVKYGINSYVAKRASTGESPDTPNSQSWQMLAEGAKAVYGSSDTAAATAAKTVTSENGDYNLEIGVPIIVYFEYTDTSTDATLNIDASGARAIYNEGAAIKSRTLEAGQTYLFVYDGIHYVLVGGGSSGHKVLDSNGTELTKRPALQFDGMNVDDDATNDKTVVRGQLQVSPSLAHWNRLTQAEKDDPNVYWVRLWADNSSFATDKTPVGTVLSMAADSAEVTDPFPTEDYLLCGGGTKNIADYPKLAAYFTDAYGSANYFGGDGITTFGIPNFSADYPTNGVLVIKAKITGRTITVCDLDDTLTTTSNTWSAAKIQSEIDALTALIGGE